MRNVKYIVLIMFFLACIGCNNNVDKVDNLQIDDNQEVQIVDDNEVIDKNPVTTVDEQKENNQVNDKSKESNEKSNNSNNQKKNNANNSSSKSSQEKTNSNISSNNSNNQKKTDDNSNVNNSNQEIDNRPRIINPTIAYECPSGYEKKDNKCVGSVVYNAKSVQSCPYGFEIFKGKCNRPVFKDAKLLVENCVAANGFPGERCITNKVVDSTRVVVNGNCPPGEKCDYETNNIEDYTKPTVICPDNSSLNSSDMKCYDLNNINVDPISINCDSNKTLIVRNGVNTCYGMINKTEYVYYQCPKNYILENIKCRETVPKYSCDDDMYYEGNGRCIKGEEAPSIYTYTCNTGDEKSEEKEDMCVHINTLDLTVVYKCPSDYALTVDNRCILES